MEFKCYVDHSIFDTDIYWVDITLMKNVLKKGANDLSPILFTESFFAFFAKMLPWSLFDLFVILSLEFNFLFHLIAAFE